MLTLMYFDLQGWNFYSVMVVGNIFNGVRNPTDTQRPKEFRSDNIVDNLRASVGFFYLS